MTKLYFLLIFSFISFTFSSCKGDKTAVATTKKAEVPAVTYDLPGIPPALVQDMAKNVTMIDYYWRDLPFSTSHEDKEGIMQSLSFITTDVPKSIPGDCKSLGRKTFQVKGDIILEAEVYIGDNCAAYVFYKDNKPVYISGISKQGVGFYNYLIKSGLEQAQKLNIPH